MPMHEKDNSGFEVSPEERCSYLFHWLRNLFAVWGFLSFIVFVFGLIMAITGVRYE